jgi:hypothetical protein
MRVPVVAGIASVMRAIDRVVDIVPVAGIAVAVYIAAADIAAAVYIAAADIAAEGDVEAVADGVPTCASRKTSSR